MRRGLMGLGTVLLPCGWVLVSSGAGAALVEHGWMREDGTYLIFPGPDTLLSARGSLLAAVLVIGWSWSRQRKTAWIGSILCLACFVALFVDLGGSVALGFPGAEGWAFVIVGLILLSSAWWPRKV